jgi:methylglutaconyl-CoA hydratase
MSTTEFDTITLEVRDRVGIITLNRPDKRNALNFVVIDELKRAFTLLDSDPNAKVVLLRANGQAFCAGADLEYLQKLQSFGLQENLADSTHLMELYQLIYRFRKLVVAQIEGHAIAGGCGLATVCDLAYAVPEAKFGYTEVKIGFIPALVLVIVQRKIGDGRARELLLTGDLISATRAAEIGLISGTLPADTIADTVWATLQRLIRENAAGSIEVTKRMLADLATLPVDDALKFAAKMNAHARATAECQRGISAFLNKEKIEW